MKYIDKLDLQTEGVKEVETLEKHTIINDTFSVNKYNGHKKEFLPIGGDYNDGFRQLNETVTFGVNCKVSRELNDKISKNTFMVNVKDFGAKGDGIADDTQAFKDTVTYVNKFFLDTNYQTMLEIFIPAGVYIIKDTIEFIPPKGVSASGGNKSLYNLRGSGRQSTKIFFSGNNVPCFKFTKCQVLLSDFLINCTNSRNGIGISLGESYQRDPEDSILTVVNHSTFQRVWIMGNPTALEIRYCFDTSFYDCYFSSVRDFTNNDTNSAVLNILPLEDEMSNHLNFVRCHFEGTEAKSTQLKIVGGSNNMYPHTMTFTSCHFETRNLSSRAFYLEYCKGIAFNNCAFMRNKNIENNDTKEETPCIIKNSYHIEFNNCNFNGSNNNEYKPYIELYGSVPSLCLINTLMNSSGKYDLNSYINYENLSDFDKDAGSWLINIYRGYNTPSLNFGFNRVSSLTQNYRRFENTYEIVEGLDASVFKHNLGTTNSKFNSDNVNYFAMNSIGAFSAHTYKSTNKKSIEANSSSQFEVTTSNNSKRGVYMIIMDVSATAYALVFFDGSNLHQINCGTQAIVSNVAPESTSASKMYIYLTNKNITVMNTFSSSRNVMIIPFVF